MTEVKHIYYYLGSDPYIVQGEQALAELINDGWTLKTSCATEGMIHHILIRVKE